MLTREEERFLDRMEVISPEKSVDEIFYVVNVFRSATSPTDIIGPLSRMDFETVRREYQRAMRRIPERYVRDFPFEYEGIFLGNLKVRKKSDDNFLEKVKTGILLYLPYFAI